MIKFIIYTLKRFAWFKRLNAKVTYEALGKAVPAAEWQFMNYGYVPNANETATGIPDEPGVQKYPLQMYHYLALKTTSLEKKFWKSAVVVAAVQSILREPQPCLLYRTGSGTKRCRICQQTPYIAQSEIYSG